MYNTLIRIVSIILVTLIVTNSSVIVVAAPSTPPPGGYTGGIFSFYFKNIVEGSGSALWSTNLGLCPTDKVLSGFSTGATTYGMPICSFPISIDGQASAFTGNLRGTVGYVPKYGLTATGIVISQIYDTGTGVGIGTTTPIARLDVNGSMSLTGGNLYIRRGYISVGADGESDVGFITESGWDGIGLVGNMARINTPDLYVTHGGNVGIGGLTGATSKLEVNGLIRSLNNGTAFFQGGDDTQLADVNVSNTLGIIGLQDATRGAIQLGNNAATYIAGADGNIGIGTTTPTAKLTVTEDILINSVTIGRGNGSSVSNTVVSRGGLSQITGTGTTAIGNGALSGVTSGSHNTAVGFNALFYATTAGHNIAIGSNALRDSVTGISNIAIGVNSLTNNTGGVHNVAIGQGAIGNSSGSSNVGVGYQSLWNLGVGDNNTAIGKHAGFSLLSGGQNTFLGRSAGGDKTGGSYNIAIGYDTQLASPTGSNQLNIGNWIYGSGGNIGIGTGTSLTSKFNIAGTVKLVDGSQGTGKVLTSDANGVARWEYAVGANIPTGSVVAFNSAVCPSGWAVADGSTYGTVVSPDLRGEFVRGLDNGRGVDTARALASAQAGEMQSHGHAGSSVAAGGAVTPTGTVAAGGAHTPTGSAAAGGAHTPTGSAAAVGNHSHNGSTNNGGAHTHTYTATLGQDDAEGRPSQGRNPSTQTTSSAGLHSHSFTTNNAGGHGHTVAMNAVAAHGHTVAMNAVAAHGHTLTMNPLAAHGHTLSIANNGGVETRPRNVALLYCVKIVGGTPEESNNSTWMNTTGTATGHVVQATSGNVGIGTITPGTRLDVFSGSIRTTHQLISTTTSTAPIQVSSSVLVSNLNADLLDGQHGSYYAPTSSPILTGTPTAPTAGTGTNNNQIATTAFVKSLGFLSGAGLTTNYTPKWNGTRLVNSQIFDNGSRIGIGTAVPNGAVKMDIIGRVKITDGSQGTGKVLMSDGNGLARWDDLPDNNGNTPAGSIVAFNSPVCPAGWAPADGIGGRPDLRGEFIRGLDNGRGVDTARGLNTFQNQAYLSHNHGGTVDSANHNHAPFNTANNAGQHGHTMTFDRGETDSESDDKDLQTTGGGNHSKSTNAGEGGHQHSIDVPNGGGHAHGLTINAAGGTETRPRNVALLYCVKIAGGTPALSDSSTWMNMSGTSTGNVVLATSGNVGVGTATPANKLSIVSGNQAINLTTGTNTSSYNLNVGVNDDGVNIANNSTIRGFNFSNNNGRMLTMAANGNIGIGTSTPAVKLQVAGGDFNFAGSGVLDSTASRLFSTANSVYMQNGLGGNIYFRSRTAVNNMVITDAGNVGIGTTTPGAGVSMSGGLTINGRSPTKMTVEHNGVASFALNASTGAWQMFDKVNGLWNQSLSSSGGNVGIGTSTPGEKLDIVGNARISQGNYLKFTHTFQTDVNDGKIGAGIFDPGLNIVGIQTTTGSGRKITMWGDILVHGGGYYYASDIKLKKNIEKIDSPLKKVLQLGGYTFDWKKDGKSDIGVIAQEVEKVFPELVTASVDEDGNKIKTVKYSNLVAPIIEAIKELAAKFDTLQKTVERQQSELDTLRSENEALKARLDAIEARLAQ